MLMFWIAGAWMVACGNPADKAGIGSTCASDTDCKEEGQKCLTQFKQGYCGVADCTKDADCPTGSACITHTDTKNYCFRICTDKPECNANRTTDAEANCSGNVTFVSGEKSKKACVPPNAG
ncbi:MAG: hypothetical protein H6727_14565 [Myxococcales bacterium]|nr:hypothetical protein [Myxococcales bacterium]